MIERSEFSSWRNSEVHGEFLKYFKERSGEFAAEIINRQSIDHPRDMYIRGVIAAFVEVMEWVPEFPEVEDNGESDEV
jgi:hypothetical protein